MPVVARDRADSPTVGDPDELAICCRGVTKRFGSVIALEALDLRISRGRVTGYLGPNGAGKSTTIRILLDLARPDTGDVRVLGVDPRSGGHELRRRIGYVPGEVRLDERLSVEQTLRSWARLRGGDADWSYVDDLCRRLALDRSRHTKGLSSGNRRKLALVGAFMARPELLVLDEPTAGVDPLVQATFLELVDEARAEGRTVFLSSHVLSEVQHIADDVVVIRGGRAVATGDVDELRRSARQPFSVVFNGRAPVEELRAIRGIHGLRVDGSSARGEIEGSPSPLLGVLAQHAVDHLLMPEPDLEQAFLEFYEPSDPAS